MSPVFLTIFQAVVILALAPLSVGLVRWFKARLQGRHGAPPWLPYLTLAKLAQTENLISNTSAWPARLAPYGVLGTNIFLAVVLPLVAVGGLLSSMSNFMVIVAVSALSSSLLIIGCLDAGQALSGASASRRLTLVSLFQPSLILAFAAIALTTGSSTVNGMFPGTQASGFMLFEAPYLSLSLLALVLIALAENMRAPIDQPNARVELAMVSADATLEYSGWRLGLLEYASALKLTVWVLLIANLLWPWPLLLAVSHPSEIILVLLVTVLKVVVCLLALAVLEASLAKLRFYRLQEYLTGAFFMALLGLALTLLSRYL